MFTGCVLWNVCLERWFSVTNLKSKAFHLNTLVSNDVYRWSWVLHGYTSSPFSWSQLVKGLVKMSGNNSSWLLRTFLDQEPMLTGECNFSPMIQIFKERIWDWGVVHTPPCPQATPRFYLAVVEKNLILSKAWCHHTSWTGNGGLSFIMMAITCMQYAASTASDWIVKFA